MKKLLVMAVAALLLSSQAQANEIWNQAPDVNGNALVDQAFGDFPGFSTYAVSHVNISDATTIDSITTFFTRGGGGTDLWPVGMSGSATLNIFSSVPGAADDPSTGATVAVDYISAIVDGVEIIEVTASGLNQAIGAGDFYIGLTPILDFGVFSQEFHFGTTDTTGNPTLFRNPGGGFAIGVDWGDASLFAADPAFEASIRITEVIPEPTSAGILAVGLFGLVARRRR